MVSVGVSTSPFSGSVSFAKRAFSPRRSRRPPTLRECSSKNFPSTNITIVSPGPGTLRCSKSRKIASRSSSNGSPVAGLIPDASWRNSSTSCCSAASRRSSARTTSTS